MPSMIRSVSSPVSRAEHAAVRIRVATITPTPLVPLQPLTDRELPFISPFTRQLSKDPCT
jgi:hypothetical protein